jgi:tetratricopeptide (TPR) repeat protein
MPKAKEAALRAMSLDDGLAEANAALGLILFLYDYDFAGAERELKRAIELNPNYATGHHFYSRLLSAQGRHEEAFAEIRRARWSLSRSRSPSTGFTAMPFSTPENMMRVSRN